MELTENRRGVLKLYNWCIQSKINILVTSIVVNLAVMSIEIIYGYISNSIMLISDGLHMCSHVVSLAIALVGVYLVEKATNDLKKVKHEINSALINALFLLLFALYVIYEGCIRIMHPEQITLGGTLLVAIIGLITNLSTAMLLGKTGVEDLNSKGAYLHMLADTFSSVAILLGVFIIYHTGWFWIDGALAALVGLVMLKWSVSLITSIQKMKKRAQ